MGVDIFFVISGFLITSHLLGSIERYGRVSFAGVYAKRARRILSASFIGARPRKSMLSALAASGKCFLSRTGSCPRKGLGPMSPILA